MDFLEGIISPDDLEIVQCFIPGRLTLTRRANSKL